MAKYKMISEPLSNIPWQDLTGLLFGGIQKIP